MQTGHGCGCGRLGSGRRYRLDVDGIISVRGSVGSVDIEMDPGEDGMEGWMEVWIGKGWGWR